MKKTSIQQLATCAINRPKLLVEISYKDTGRTYRVIGYIKIKFNGQWYVQIEYQCLRNGAKYSRDAADFGSFEIL
jgi:hypothetical protein